MMPTNEAIGLVVAIVLLLSVVAGPTTARRRRNRDGARPRRRHVRCPPSLGWGSAKTGENFHLAAGVVGGGVWDGGTPRSCRNRKCNSRRGIPGMAERDTGTKLHGPGGTQIEFVENAKVNSGDAGRHTESIPPPPDNELVKH